MRRWGEGKEGGRREGSGERKNTQYVCYVTVQA